MNYIDSKEFERDLEYNVADVYAAFTESEDIPVHTGLAIDDIPSLETGFWERTGQNGAFINLHGNEGINDLQLHQLAPGEEISVQNHVHEAIVFVVSGRGATVLGADEEIVFEWGESSLFFVPPSTPYRYVNLSDSEPAYLVAQTSLPILLSVLRNPDVLFGGEYDVGRELDDQEYTSGTVYTAQADRERVGGYYGSKFPVVWKANFIPDLKSFEEIETWQDRGAGGQSVLFPTPDSMCMRAHLSEFPVGRYKKAHRHSPGANIFILNGEGYTLMWRPEWDQKVKVEWSEGSVFTPPARWYHQHFNTGSEPARYVAIHPPSVGTLDENVIFDPHDPINQIEYTEEDPEIRERFQEELDRKGVEFRMPSECYTDPDFQW